MLAWYVRGPILTPCSVSTRQDPLDREPGRCAQKDDHHGGVRRKTITTEDGRR